VRPCRIYYHGETVKALARVCAHIHTRSPALLTYLPTSASTSVIFSAEPLKTTSRTNNLYTAHPRGPRAERGAGGRRLAGGS
jgi:hypothetical protein